MLTQLSGLTRVAVSVEDESCLHLLAHRRTASIITHVNLQRWPRPEGKVPLPLAIPYAPIAPNDLSHLEHLPKLKSLSSEAHSSEVKLLPLSLEELCLQWTSWEDVSPLARLSRLTSLEIRVRGSRCVTSLVDLAASLNLRSLELSWFYGDSCLSVVSAFTTLTSLTLSSCHTEWSDTSIFPELVHLTRLVHLTVYGSHVDLGHEDLACLGHLTKLTCLNLGYWDLAECVAGSSARTLDRPVVSAVQLRTIWHGSSFQP
jgi:hypothetical protein